MSEIRRPVLRYHGGKFGPKGGLADWIVGQLPDHRIYVEPFGGAASVLLRKPRAYAEVYNDLSDSVVNVFRVLRDPRLAADLRRSLALTPFARLEFEATYGPPPNNPVEWARMTIFRSMAGFGSAAGGNPKYKTGFRANSNRSGTTPAMDWCHYPDAVPTYVERLRGVVIENGDALDVMRRHDGPDTLHYVDPPYVHSTRRAATGSDPAYAHEMDDDDHRRLAACLHELEGMVVLSGYASPLYAELFEGWPCVQRKAFADGAKERIERLWFNRAAWHGRLPMLMALEGQDGQDARDSSPFPERGAKA